MKNIVILEKFEKLFVRYNLKFNKVCIVRQDKNKFVHKNVRKPTPICGKIKVTHYQYLLVLHCYSLKEKSVMLKSRWFSLTKYILQSVEKCFQKRNRKLNVLFNLLDPILSDSELEY